MSSTQHNDFIKLSLKNYLQFVLLAYGSLYSLKLVVFIRALIEMLCKGVPMVDVFSLNETRLCVICAYVRYMLADG